MIPTYNQARFIRKAIDSALAQDYPNLEVIVGDDASTDATSSIVTSVDDPRLRYVRHSRNLGRIGNYRALLYDQATGDYVINLDGDDYYTDPTFISEAVHLISAEPDAVMVLARASWETSHNEIISDIPSVKEASGLYILSRLPRKDFFLKHMTTLYSRHAAITLDFYRSAANSSDWESLYRLSLRGSVRYLNRIVGIWRLHDRNESATSDPRQLIANLEIWPPIYADAARHGMSPMRAKLTCAKCIAYFASLFASDVSRNGNMELARFAQELLKRYTLAASMIALTPRYAGRILLGFCGYYRRKAAMARHS